MDSASAEELPVSTTGCRVFPSQPPEFAFPSAAPAEWRLRALQAADGPLTVWDFLTEPDPHEHQEIELRALVGEPSIEPYPHERRECRPWLVIAEQPGRLGAERLAVPRLMPSCEWADEAAAERWHESAWRGEAEPIPTGETVVDARAAQPTKPGRRANQQPVLLARVAVVVACDLHQREPVAIAAERQLDYSASKDSELTARRNVYRDWREGQKLLGGLGGLPWAAFPDGVLPEYWWQTDALSAAIDRWYGHAYQLAYRDQWESPVGTLSPAQEAVYVLLHLRDAEQLRPETLAAARAALETDARASDAQSVDQWVARLVLAARPACPTDPSRALHDLPVLREAWSRVRGDAGLGDDTPSQAPRNRV
jgi:hypothetical protein